MQPISEKSFPKIFALTGTSASGKTSLFNALQKENPSFSFVPEAARTYYQNHDIPLEKRATFENQRDILDYYKKSLDAAIQTGAQIIITDSTPLAAISYAALSPLPQDAERMHLAIPHYLSPNTFSLVLDPSDIDYRFDPTDIVRMETEKQRLRVHASLLELLEEFQMPYSIIKGNLRKRIQTIQELLRAEHLLKKYL